LAGRNISAGQVGVGAIVILASISSFIAQPQFVTYNATKAAAPGITRCMALDLAAHNIRVNAVAPAPSERKSTAADPGGEPRAVAPPTATRTGAAPTCCGASPSRARSPTPSCSWRRTKRRS
jgi:NAD(P)-dependent dehydrogenase (short-subunit alcohol dehydrogenase family)